MGKMGRKGEERRGEEGGGEDGWREERIEERIAHELSVFYLKEFVPFTIMVTCTLHN